MVAERIMGDSRPRLGEPTCPSSGTKSSDGRFVSRILLDASLGDSRGIATFTAKFPARIFERWGIDGILFS